MVVAWEERLRRDRGQTFRGGEEVEERQESQGLYNWCIDYVCIGMAEWTSLVYISVRLADSYQEEEPWEAREWPSGNHFVVLSAQALETC